MNNNEIKNVGKSDNSNNSFIKDLEAIKTDDIGIKKMLNELKNASSSDSNNGYFINKTKLFSLLNLEPNNEQIIHSNKPLWVPDVKVNCDKVIPNLEIKELEHAKDLIKDEYTELQDTDEYPFYQTIKKLLYAFGDESDSDPNTVVFMHDFLKKWLINLMRILNECEVKKVLEHLYSFEYSKYFKYKKIKTKNKINTAEVNDVNDGASNGLGDLGLDGIVNIGMDFEDNDQDIENEGNEHKEVNLENTSFENENGLSELSADNNNNRKSNKNKLKNNNTNNDNSIYYNNTFNNLNNIKGISNKENNYDELLDYEDDIDENENEDKKEKIDPIENLFEDKNDSYYENLMFQDMRTKNMKENEYFHYINCRTTSFLTKNKKILTYFQKVTDNVAVEVKELNCLELICFLAKELFYKIIKSAVRARDPDYKLHILKYPLKPEELEKYTEEEVEKLDEFLNDYYSNLYLIKEFKKKKLLKNNNKLVKTKKIGCHVVIIISKLVFFDEDESLELKKIKKESERNLLKTFKDNKLNKNYKPRNYYEFYILYDKFKNKMVKRRIDKKFLEKKFDEWKEMERSERNEIKSIYLKYDFI